MKKYDYVGICPFCKGDLTEIEVNYYPNCESEREEGTFKCEDCNKEFSVMSKWTIEEMQPIKEQINEVNLDEEIEARAELKKKYGDE